MLRVFYEFVLAFGLIAMVWLFAPLVMQLLR